MIPLAICTGYNYTGLAVHGSTSNYLVLVIQKILVNYPLSTSNRYGLTKYVLMTTHKSMLTV